MRQLVMCIMMFMAAICGNGGNLGSSFSLVQCTIPQIPSLAIRSQFQLKDHMQFKGGSQWLYKDPEFVHFLNPCFPDI